MNLRPLGYEPNELPGCSTPRQETISIPEFKIDPRRHHDYRVMRPSRTARRTASVRLAAPSLPEIAAT